MQKDMILGRTKDTDVGRTKDGEADYKVIGNSVEEDA